jgi:hypothetical protein
MVSRTYNTPATKISSNFKKSTKIKNVYFLQTTNTFWNDLMFANLGTHMFFS